MQKQILIYRIEFVQNLYEGIFWLQLVVVWVTFVH